MLASSLALILSTLAADPSDEKPVAAREVYRCDFEAAADRDFDAWPDGWTRQRGPGLPAFVPIGIVLNDSPATTPLHPGATPSAAISTDPGSAQHCLRIDLDGSGGVVSSPAIAISPHFSYVVATRIKTGGLSRDAAWVTLSLFDAEGNALETHDSPLVQGDTPWRTVEIGPITPAHEKIAKAVLTLHLRPRDRHGDLTGSASFDDVWFARLPRIALFANQRTHLFTLADTAEVRCDVSGIADLYPAVTFELFDHLGQKIASHRQMLDAATTNTDGNTFAGGATWRPPLPDYGFFHVRAALHGEDRTVLDRTISLALLRPIPAPSDGEFGWTLHSDHAPLPPGPLASLLGQVGIHWAKLPVWFDPSQSLRAEQIASFAEQVSLQGVELVGVLDQPPAELRQLFREQGRLPVASVFIEPELWQPALSPVLTRLSLKIRWWQLGADDDTSYVSFPQLERKITEIKRALEQFGQEIHLGFGWRLPYEAPRAPSPPWSFLSYSSEPALTAEELADYLPDLKRPGSQRWLILNPLARGEYSTEARARDLVMRMISAKLSGANAAFIPQPFDPERGLLNPDGTPGELLLPWRTTSRLISGADYLGQVQLPGGSTNHIFARDGQAVMVVWSDEPTQEWMFFGDEVEQIDLWGRATRPQLAQHDGQSQHRFDVGHSPTFITGLSEAVARWQIALAFETQQLASVFGREQTIVLQLRNTFVQGIGGEVTLHAPKSWSVDGRPLRFKLNQADSIKLKIPVTLLTDANSGPQPLRLDFDITAERNYRFSVHRTLQLGLEDVQLRLTTRLRDDGSLLVEQQITNLSDFPISFQCILFPPGRRRETRQVIDLGRGRNSLTFILPNGNALLGQKLWLRAEEIRGPRVLNYTITAEP
ncbi:MAG: hypothetical protein WD872_12545 [Pirellulaceae bacterium]